MASSSSPASKTSQSNSSSSSRTHQNHRNAGSSSASHASRISAAKETFSVLQELSRLLNTGLDAESLSLCVSLCENGANPEALATVIREIRKESAALQHNQVEKWETKVRFLIFNTSFQEQ